MTKTKIKSLAKFAYNASGQDWIPYNYLRTLSDYISKGIAKGNLRLIVSMPPRHGKSEMISHWLPRYFLEARPSKRVILATYGDQFATKWGRKVRNGIKENTLHRKAELASDKEAASNFYTTEGGGMLSAGIKGGITGEGADLLVVDDPIKNWEQAHSPNVRDSINQEFEATLNTRLEPGASVIVLMTRWHSDDVAGFAHNEYDWEFLRFPMIADEDSVANNHLDDRDIGDYLNSDRYGKDRVDEIKSNLSKNMWKALYQQEPVDQQQGSLWSYDIIERGSHPTDMERIVVAIDPAVTSNEQSDETGIVCVGKDSDEYFVLGDESGVYTPNEWANQAIALYKKWDADVIIGEVNNGGDMVEQNIRNVNRSVHYKDVRATRGKSLRAEPIVGLYENSKVTHIEQFDKLESQMVSYSGEKSSESPDRMDALVWAMTELSDHGKRAGAW